MSIFQSVGNFFEGVTGGYWGGANANDATVKQPTETVEMPSVALPTRRPDNLDTGATSGGGGGGGFLSDIGDFLETAGGVVATGVETYYGAKSKFEQAQTASELDSIKMQAVRQSAAKAPAPAQIVLPSFNDWLNDPREAASRVTPAAIAGSGAVTGGISLVTLGLIGATIFLMARK
jgi:hypothetical protein